MAANGRVMEKGRAALRRPVLLTCGYQKSAPDFDLVAELSGRTRGPLSSCCFVRMWTLMVFILGGVTTFVMLAVTAENESVKEPLTIADWVAESNDKHALRAGRRGHRADQELQCEVEQALNKFNDEMNLILERHRHDRSDFPLVVRVETNPARDANRNQTNEDDDEDHDRNASGNHSLTRRRLLSWMDKVNAKPLRSKRRLLQLSWLMIGVLLSCGLVVHMHHQHGHGSRHHQQNPQQHAHVGDAGPPFLGTATLKVPPAWSVERASHYSLRAWTSDLVLWAGATDLEPHRLGPIAALQISGSAKELVREIGPDMLANGMVDPQTGQHISGLMVLVRTLAQRYAPLDAEVSTRSVSEFLNFQILPGESIDAVLVRFDVLRSRATLRGGLGINSWLLLKALGLSADFWDRLLQPLGGNLPTDENQLQQLIERIRRQGHLFEGGMRTPAHTQHQGGTGDPGAYADFPTFNAPNSPYEAHTHSNPFGTASAGQGCPGFGSGFGLESVGMQSLRGSSSGQGAYATQGSDQCPACETFFMDEDISSATSTDDGELDLTAASSEAFPSVEVDAGMHDDNAMGNSLHHAYLLAKKRWRRFTGRPPRRYRKYHNRSRPYQRLQRTPFRSSYTSFLPANAFAGGKGHQKGGKGGQGPRLNPRGRDGKPLKCNKCGSESHLWRACPMVAKGASAAHHAAVPPRSAVSFHTARASSDGRPSSGQGHIEVWSSEGQPAVANTMAVDVSRCWHVCVQCICAHRH